MRPHDRGSSLPLSLPRVAAYMKQTVARNDLLSAAGSTRPIICFLPEQKAGPIRSDRLPSKQPQDHPSTAYQTKAANARSRNFRKETSLQKEMPGGKFETRE